MANLTEEMVELIKKNLPEYVGAELKTFIDDANTTKRELGKVSQTLREERAAATKVVIERDALRTENKNLTSKVEEVLKLEQDLIARERDLKVTILECKLSGMTSQRDTLERLTETAFKNHAVRQKMFGTVPVAVEGVAPSQYNSCGSPGYVNSSPIETTTETSEL